jgi:hypothetical protein
MEAHDSGARHRIPARHSSAAFGKATQSDGAPKIIRHQAVSSDMIRQLSGALVPMCRPSGIARRSDAGA